MPFGRELQKQESDSTHALSVLTREKDGDGSADALPVQENRGPFELLVREHEIERRLRVEFDPLFGRRALTVSVSMQANILSVMSVEFREADRSLTLGRTMQRHCSASCARRLWRSGGGGPSEWRISCHRFELPL